MKATEGTHVQKGNGKFTNETHVLAKHGDQVSDQYLYDRTADELGKRNAVGSRTAFNDRTQMESAIANSIQQNQQAIDAWIASSPPAGLPKAFTADPGLGNLGRGFEITSKGGPIAPITRPMKNVNLVLIPNGRGGYLIYTAHPF